MNLSHSLIATWNAGYQRVPSQHVKGLLVNVGMQKRLTIINPIVSVASASRRVATQFAVGASRRETDLLRLRVDSSLDGYTAAATTRRETAASVV
jgi:hypothetical protein